MKKFQYFKSNNLTKKLILGKQTSVLCTLSGGQDSVLTFFILLHAQSKESLQILCCQHFWQVKNFFVAHFLFQISYLFKVGYTLILPQINLLNENDSRQWRKKNYWRVSQIEQILTCVTGHTETDTLEKNLNNIFRGASPQSFCYYHFLNFENKTHTFFSNINVNTSSIYKILESKKYFDQLKFTNEKNKKNSLSFSKKRIIKSCQFFPSISFRSKQATCFSQKQSFWLKNLNFLKISKQNEGLNPSFCWRDQNKNSNCNFGLKFSKFKKGKGSTFKFYKQKKTFLNKFNFHLINSRSNENFKGMSITVKNFYLLQKIDNSVKIHTEIYNKQKKLFYSLKSLNSSSFSFSSRFFNLNISFKKPLQKTSRVTVSKILHLYTFPHIIDVTNFSFCFSRNKIRHQLIPFMRCLVQPKIDSIVTQFFEMLNQENHEQEKELAEIVFLYKLVNYKFWKKERFYVQYNPTKKLFFSPLILQPSFLPFQTVKTTESFREFDKLVISDFNQNLANAKKRKIAIFLFLTPKTKCFIKNMIKKISITTTRSLSKKLFFEYKNLNLNYSQIIKLQDFY